MTDIYHAEGHKLNQALALMLHLDPHKLTATGLEVRFDADGYATVRWQEVAEDDEGFTIFGPEGDAVFEEWRERRSPATDFWAAVQAARQLVGDAEVPA